MKVSLVSSLYGNSTAYWRGGNWCWPPDAGVAYCSGSLGSKGERMNRSEAFDKTGDVPQWSCHACGAQLDPRHPFSHSCIPYTALQQQQQASQTQPMGACNRAYESTQQLRRAALAKLTTEEIDALGVRNLRWYDDLNHGSGQSEQK